MCNILLDKSRILKNELLRKSIHLTSVWIPFAIFYFDKKFVLFLLFLSLILVLIFEIVRKSSGKLADIINYWFKGILRVEEKTGKLCLTGAFYMIIASITVVIAMPKLIATTSLAILIISDSLSALVGKIWGKTKIGSKSFEGSLAFFLSAFLISLLLIKSQIIILIFACLITTISELYAKRIRIDDNLLIPISFCLSYHFLTFWR